MTVQWNVAVVPSMMVWFTGVVTKLGGTAKKRIASFCLCCKINMTLTERPVSRGQKAFKSNQLLTLNIKMCACAHSRI